MSSSTAPPPQSGMDWSDIEGVAPPGAGMMPQAELVGGEYGGTVTGDPFLGPDGRPTGPWALSEGSTGATYYEGDQFRVLKGLTTEDLVRVQQQLAAVGLVSKPFYGDIDDGTIAGFSKLLSMSNRSGTSWDATLTRLATNPAIAESADEDPEFEEQPYLAPDMATIAQRIKETFRGELGREPDQYEMAQLTAELTGYDRMAHQREQELRELQHGQATTPGVQEPGQVQAVDPVSRFREAFESKYANELQFVEDKEDAQESRAVVEAGTSTLSQMSRGG